MHKKKHLIKEPPPFQFHDVDVETMKQSKLKDCIVRNNALDSDEGTNAVGTAALNDTTSDHEEDEEDVELDDDEDPLDNDEWFEQGNENDTHHDQRNNVKHISLEKNMTSSMMEKKNG